MLRRQLDAIDGVVSTGTGSDGRADIVFFEADRAGRAAALQSRLTETVFAETGRASRVAGAGAMAVASMGLAGRRRAARAVGLGGGGAAARRVDDLPGGRARPWRSPVPAQRLAAGDDRRG